jgi:prepilin-type N-terminal cleavage/methylation domain-containing protein
MRRASHKGFTLVEVMVALGVMTISAMALMSMQGQATRANGHARDMTTAAQIAQTVLERLKLDALAWTSITAADPGDVTLATVWLKDIASAIPGNFMTLSAQSFTRLGNTVQLSNAFNQYGEDVPLTGAAAGVLASVKFCASTRLGWIYTTRRVIRADVRVWWTKEVPTRSILGDFLLCADDNSRLAPGGARYDDYHTVYLSTVIRPHPN